jgi:hypothetical protein
MNKKIIVDDRSPVKSALIGVINDGIDQKTVDILDKLAALAMLEKQAQLSANSIGYTMEFKMSPIEPDILLPKNKSTHPKMRKSKGKWSVK